MSSLLPLRHRRATRRRDLNQLLPIAIVQQRKKVGELQDIVVTTQRRLVVAVEDLQVAVRERERGIEHLNQLCKWAAETAMRGSTA